MGYTQIMQGIRTVESVHQPIEVELAEKDQPILATAIAEECDVLVNGRSFEKADEHKKVDTP